MSQILLNPDLLVTSNSEESVHEENRLETETGRAGLLAERTKNGSKSNQINKKN